MNKWMNFDTQELLSNKQQRFRSSTRDIVRTDSRHNVVQNHSGAWRGWLCVFNPASSLEALH